MAGEEERKRKGSGPYLANAGEGVDEVIRHAVRVAIGAHAHRGHGASGGASDPVAHVVDGGLGSGGSGGGATSLNDLRTTLLVGLQRDEEVRTEANAGAIAGKPH